MNVLIPLTSTSPRLLSSNIFPTAVCNLLEQSDRRNGTRDRFGQVTSDSILVYPIISNEFYSAVDLIAALTLAGRHQRRQGCERKSPKPFPSKLIVESKNNPYIVTGGVARECATGYQEIIITGHEDGSLKFWHASGEALQIMYKLKTGRHFEKTDPNDTRPISNAVKELQICVDSRLLLVAGANGQVTLFRFMRSESSQDIAVVILPQLCSSTNRSSSPQLTAEPNKHHASSSRAELKRQTENVGVSHDSQNSTGWKQGQNKLYDFLDTSCGSQIAESIPIKVRGGHLRRPAGYQVG